MSKGEQRARALGSRHSLSTEANRSLSSAVTRRFLELPEFKEARVVACYVAKADEVQTSGIITAALAAGKTLVVPRADPATGALSFASIASMSELSPGHFGVLEPNAEAHQVPLSEANVAVVPVVAWDEEGHRLGYGKGYFDRALSANPAPVRAGLAFEAQEAPTLPQSPGDVLLDIVVTEARVVRFGRRAL